MAKTTTKSNIASVLAFEKKVVPSDGYMYQTTWTDHATENEKAIPIQVNEKAIKGTISNRLKKAVKDDPLKLNAEIQKANLQVVDSASLDMDHDTLKVSFTLKFLGDITPEACNNTEHLKGIRHMVASYKADFGFKEIAQRYAANLANGRFLWRNTIGADKLEVQVSLPESKSLFTFNALDYPLKEFKIDEKVQDLANEIASVWKDDKPYLYAEVTAWIRLGKGQEVYPSEELVLEKKKSKSKILYSANNTAALHSQKIGNALRTIDDWYPESEDTGDYRFPIAVEPYGAVTTRGIALRPPKSQKDFYTLFDAWSTGKDLDTAEDKHYVMAVLIRGGVFGASGKE